MDEFSSDALRRDFRTAEGFNDLFESFRTALDRRIEEIDLYRELLCNTSLKSDELLFFAKRLSEVFPRLGYDTYLWLARVFESRQPEAEGLDLAFLCLKKASEFSPASDRPYLAACDIYSQDLNIPALDSIVSFLRTGTEKVGDPVPICERLSVFYKMLGNDEMFQYYRPKSRR